MKSSETQNTPENTKGLIIQKILSTREEKFTENAYIVLYEADLEYGSKKIHLALDLGEKQITHHIENTSSERAPNETTLLHEAIKLLILEQTNKFKTPLTFKFITRYKTLIKWAQSTGNILFQWDKEEPSDKEFNTTPETEKREITFSKTFYPKIYD